MDAALTDANIAENISGYARISVDTEKEEDENTSIENQIKIISDFVKRNFPKCKLTLYKDRDRSGYTFEQREDYQKMRKILFGGKSKILIVKDFSRFARRNSLGLWELEQLRDCGVRIISIMDGIDYPRQDDWMMIQFRFMINEVPITDTSKKVRKVIDNKQQNGEWLCAVPYGYNIINQKKQQFEIVPDEAEIIKTIFNLYNNSGWGYKKIANYLTEKNIPTPRMKEKERAEKNGEIYRRKFKPEWSIITIQGILKNDFYIGTLRQHKYTRKKINGNDEKLSDDEHIIFQKHHNAIIDDKTYLYTQELLKQRTTANYRGIKKYDTPYSGLLYCGECQSPMFSMSRSDIPSAYTCGTYHKRGLKGCTSHHIRVDFLNSILKDYVRMVKLNSKDMISQLEKSIEAESDAVRDNDKVLALLENQLHLAKEELKATKKQKIKDIAKNPDDADIYEETYAEMENELVKKIYGLKEQVTLNMDKRNNVIEINRAAKTVFSVFDDILRKDKLDKTDISLIVDKIIVYENKTIDIKLKGDIEELLKVGTLPNREVNANFSYDSIGILFDTTYTSKPLNQRAKAYTVNVISDADPLEIFTDKDGEVIFKKYSPIGELGEFAAQYAEALAKTSGLPICITDRDSVIAVAGISKREFLEKRVSGELEKIMGDKSAYNVNTSHNNNVALIDGNESYHILVAQPIIADGDSIGSVAFFSDDSNIKIADAEEKLVNAAAGFLGRHMEN